MEGFDRRELLARGAALGATAVVPGWAAKAFAAPSRSPLAELSRLVDGPVLTRKSAAYARARLLFSPRFDGVHPQAVVQAASVRDVQRTVLWACRHGVRLATRSGGHSFAGYSTGPGVVLDVSRLRKITVDAKGRATIGAGARLIDVDAALWRHRRAIPAGSCPTVGIAGLALGGGTGYSSRKLGLTCDSVLGLTIVTADGKALAADPKHHPDLYWASRGGGGGNFGVATSFVFRTYPVGNVTTFLLEWPWTQARAIVQAWQSLGPHAPDELFSTLNLTAFDPGVATRLRVTVKGQFFGTPAQLKNALGPLISSGTPSRVRIQEKTFMDAAFEFAGCADVDRCRREPQGKVSRQAWSAKSDYANRLLTTAAIRTMATALEARVADPKLGAGAILLDAYGGAIGRVPKAATAFVHRDALFSIAYFAYFRGGGNVAANVAWTRKLHAAMRPYVSGFAYQNYVDPDLGDWAHAYYGTNYARLRKVKRRYDPRNVFRFAQSIRP